MIDKEITYDVPRFMSFIELAYLHEAITATDKYFQEKIESTEDRDDIGNLNATRQSLHHAAFLSACAMIEQHLDANCIMDGERRNVKVKPNDLRHRGVYRSIAYANKVLGYSIDRNESPWKELFQLQEVRNHLIHFGPSFDTSDEHAKRIEKFNNLSFVSLRPTICFSIDQLIEVRDLLMSCAESFLVKPNEHSQIQQENTNGQS